MFGRNMTIGFCCVFAACVRMVMCSGEAASGFPDLDAACRYFESNNVQYQNLENGLGLSELQLLSGSRKIYSNSRSLNRDARPKPEDTRYIKAIVLSATAGKLEAILPILAGLNPERQVSVHMAILRDGSIISSLPAENRSWFVGAGRFASLENDGTGRSNLNAAVYSIFLVNNTNDVDGNRVFEEYTPEQIDTLKKILPHLVTKFELNPACIFGLGDVYPQKYQTPYHTFYNAWKELGEMGLGLWAKKEDRELATQILGKTMTIDNDLCYDLLYALGYTWDRESAAECDAVVRQIQRHFLCAGASHNSEAGAVTGLSSGNIPQEVCELALALCIKYRDLPWVMSRASKNAQALLQACTD